MFLCGKIYFLYFSDRTQFKKFVLRMLSLRFSALSFQTTVIQTHNTIRLPCYKPKSLYQNSHAKADPSCELTLLILAT